MDSWKFMLEGRGVYLSEDFEFQFDNHGYDKNKLVGCEFKPLSNVGESYPLVSSTQGLERLDCIGMGFDGGIKKSYSISSDPSGEVLSDEIGNVASPSFGEENDCGSKNKELREANDYGSFARSSPRVKRSRSTSSYMLSPRCRVLGCDKDLRSYKGYYKRHKVCDVHTRTARVTVDGLEQRFCQQCSRFHQLAEFDDGRRSCRKRLAVHNKRRRKSQPPSELGTGTINFSSSHASSETKGNDISTQTSTIVDSPIVHQPGHALSLLSSQTRNATLINKSGNSTSNLWHALNSSQDVFKNMAQIGFHAPEMYLKEPDSRDHTNVVHSGSDTMTPHIPGDGKNTRLEHGIVLDLLQLSSRLQMIEQKKLSTESEAG